MGNTSFGTWRGFVGLLGICFVFLSSIILFVVIVEYDPVGKELKRQGTSSTGSVLSMDPPVVEVGGESYRLLRHDAIWKLEAGKVLYGYHDEQAFMDESTIPHAPRNDTDFIIPILFFMISVAMLSCDPRILYIDVHTS